MLDLKRVYIVVEEYVREEVIVWVGKFLDFFVSMVLFNYESVMDGNEKN